MIPNKLHPDDEIRVLSPATSLGFIPADQRRTAEERLNGLGLKVTYAKNAELRDQFDSSPVEARIADLHDAFADPSVAAVLSTLGGYNSNQLLEGLDYDLIRNNPKILCGFSDITALATAIHAKTGLVTYSGPHFSTFAMIRGIDYTREQFVRCLMQDEPFEVAPADHWSDDPWYAEQQQRKFVPNPGYRVLQQGEAEGKLLGGNLITFCLLSGTPFMPDLEGSVLLLESDEETRPEHLDGELQSLVMQPGFAGVRGLVFGRFQKASGIDADTLATIVQNKPRLAQLPIIADANFGHTTPQFTFPIGGHGRLTARDGNVSLVIDTH
jgi:muramoyltetrapeptide carboxypeptidase LdcA involved in peptidoglycan recycling